MIHEILRRTEKYFRENFSFSIDTRYAGAIVRCVIKQYILQEGGKADGQKISKLVKLVRRLTQLALEIGTLLAVIKMIAESIR